MSHERWMVTFVHRYFWQSLPFPSRNRRWTATRSHKRPSRGRTSRRTSRRTRRGVCGRMRVLSGGCARRCGEVRRYLGQVATRQKSASSKVRRAFEGRLPLRSGRSVARALPTRVVGSGRRRHVPGGGQCCRVRVRLGLNPKPSIVAYDLEAGEPFLIGIEEPSLVRFRCTSVETKGALLDEECHPNSLTKESPRL